jgi:uncharacterized Rossmann fold enzyme
MIKLSFKNVLKDVAANSNLKPFKNMSEFVKKYSKPNANLSRLMSLMIKQKKLHPKMALMMLLAKSQNRRRCQNGKKRVKC